MPMKAGIFVSFFFVVGLPAPIFGQVTLYQHFGVNNPVDEGFVLVTSGSGGIVGPVPSDGGVAAWSTQVGAGGTAWYSAQLDSAAMTQNDWVLSVRVRPVQSGPTFENSFVGVRTSAYVYNLWFGVQADGDPLVRAGAFATGPVFVLEGAGT